ncbi:hypothetical protein OIU34_26475 [Pararhizobium sp. BT-229]|uniref:hypothetical protein n=1 Tax=Pararhizobium sp. BT-229 TaxID=2986923 RepID=UPI0021F7FB35|nr:hypothetical protein [Pararhizobium sp. BT-229]MCV9965428.1 hypothetical protein [Pararhizobium sp. BT-229]
MRIERQAACRASVTAGYGDSRTEKCRRTFGPPYLLVDYQVAVHSSNNGSFSASRYASGAQIKIEERINESYDRAIDIAGEYMDVGGEFRLKESKRRHMDYFLTYSTNQDTLELTVNASGHGWDLDRKRGWQDTSLIAHVLCIAPENLTDQLVAEFLKPPDRVIFQNDFPTSKHIVWAAVDHNRQCSSVATPTVTMIGSVGKESILVPKQGALEGRVCARLYDNAPTGLVGINFCEYKGGDRILLASVPLNCKN